jgi:hypothetical protein
MGPGWKWPRGGGGVGELWYGVGERGRERGWAGAVVR